MVVDDAKLATPKIFAGACARPETGMDFGLAFMTRRPQTVNLACKREGEYIDRGFKSKINYFVIFFEFFRKVF